MITDIYQEKRHELSLDGQKFLISPEQVQKIRQVISINNEMVHVLAEQIESFNIPTEHARKLASIILLSKSADAALNYLFDRKVTLDMLNGENIFEVFDIYNIDRDLIYELMQFTWDATPTVGKGEVFFALMLKDASKIDECGDVIIGDNVVDIKGDGARLKGQHGFGMGHEASDFWAGVLEKRQVFNKELINIPPAGSTEYNLTADNFAIDKIGNILFESDNQSYLWKRGFQQVFTESDFEDFNFVDSAYSSGALDREKLKIGLIRFSIQYYFKIESIDKLLISKFSIRKSDSTADIERLGSVAIIDKNDNLTDEYLKSIATYTLPSFSSGAGSQGGALGISINSCSGFLN